MNGGRPATDLIAELVRHAEPPDDARQVAAAHVDDLAVHQNQRQVRANWSNPAVIGLR